MSIVNVMIVTAAGVPYRFEQKGAWQSGSQSGPLWCGLLPGKVELVELPEKEILLALPAPRSVRYHQEGESTPLQERWAERKRSARRRHTAIGIVAVLATLVVVIGLVTAARTDAKCLRHGYPSSSFAFPWSFYCVKRVDQTDVVTPIEDVEP